MTASIPADNLPPVPLPPYRLVGRERDIDAIITMLEDEHTRLVTLTGPGGVGKTHLSLELAAAMAPRFVDGVVFVPMASIREPGMVLPAIAQAIGVRETRGQALIETLASALTGQSLLIVLDNMEQVVEAAPDIGVLLAATEHPRFLATSRSPLRLRAEREYPVHPLPLPDASVSQSTDSLVGNPVIALFIERAQAARPSFTLTKANADAVVEICRRLDGLPLAIELAAAMTRVLSPRALLSRMEQRWHLQMSGATDLPDRQRTLRNAIAWSYDLLRPDERDVFRRFAVFATGAPLEGVEAVCAEGDMDTLLEIVTSLVDKNLIFRMDDTEASDGSSDEPRFRMLTTIREFAAEALDTSGEADKVRRRHLDWLLSIASQAEPALTGPAQVHWLERLDTEQDNIRAALTWALDEAPEDGMRLASMLWRYWATRGMLTEGHTWLCRFLALPVKVDDNVRAKTLGSVGNLSVDLGDYTTASDAYSQALEIRERIGPERGIADALNGLGLVDWYRGDYDAARKRHLRSLEIRRRINDRVGEGNSLTNLGNAIKDAGDAQSSRPFHEQALEVRQRLGDRAGVGYSYLNLGDIARRLGDAAEARTMFNKSLGAFRDVGDTLGIGYAMQGLGMAEWLAGDAIQASARFLQALEIRSGLGDRRGIVECIEGIATVAATSDHPLVATTLFGAASALREQLGAHLPLPDQKLYEPIIETIRLELPSFIFSDKWDEGAGLGLADATRMASSIADEISIPAPQQESGGLSAREIEVLKLVAAGMTNAQVADRLYLSRRTVDAHLRRIYDKLDLSSRADVIRYAIRHNLT